MRHFVGKTVRWDWRDGVVELTLDHEPANEIGTATLAGLEKFAAAIPALAAETAACIISSAIKTGFSAGADLRELYRGAEPLSQQERLAGVRQFLERIHTVLNAIDAAPFVTIAAVHGICFGGGFEMALACDIIIADKMARFAFRELLLTGRIVNAARAHAVGLVAQLAAEGEALKIARSTAAQITKFDAVTRAAAKKFIKPIPHDELRREIDLFCELFTRPTVMAALRKFVESTDAMPYLP